MQCIRQGPSVSAAMDDDPVSILVEGPSEGIGLTAGRRSDGPKGSRLPLSDFGGVQYRGRTARSIILLMLLVQSFTHLSVSDTSKSKGRQDTEASYDSGREQTRSGDAHDPLRPRHMMLSRCEVQAK